MFDEIFDNLLFNCGKLEFLLFYPLFEMFEIDFETFINLFF